MTACPWHIAVLIPARNEEALLPRCLASVQRARLALSPEVTTDLILASDCSTDATQRIASEIIGTSGMVTCTSIGRVGSARALAARVALSRFHGPLHHCWLANTDADCVVPEDWLTLQLAIARRGLAAVAGIVDVDSFEDHRPTVPQLFRLTYLLHPDGTHPHVHGANLGVRADAYLQAGGWAPQATAEDHDLWQRLHHAQLPRLSDAELKVLTSGRRIGRAPGGFADALAAHNDAKA